MIERWFAEVAAPVSEGLTTVENLAAAVGLLVLTLSLIALEFILVSGGMVGVAAVICGVAAVSFAFAAGTVTGWLFTVLVPILAMVGIRVGLRWMQRSTLVSQSEIHADAGYHHVLDGSGIAVGSTGEMVTAAMPTGRARFVGSNGQPLELDVIWRGGSADRGTLVVIRAIEGPVVFVGSAPLSPSNLSKDPA